MLSNHYLVKVSSDLLVCQTAAFMFFLKYVRGAPRWRVLRGRSPSLLETKAMLLLADAVRQLSRDNIHSGSNQFKLIIAIEF